VVNDSCRVWEGSRLLGDLTIGASGGHSAGTSRRGSKDQEMEAPLGGVYKSRPDPGDVPHLGCMVQALAIDKRSK
jgi:hypothetical protein